MTGTDYTKDCLAFDDDLMSCNMFYVDSVSYKIFIETIGPFSTKLLVIPWIKMILSWAEHMPLAIPLIDQNVQQPLI